MISILIPTYNTVCTEMVKRMKEKACKCGQPYEILLADDASPSMDIRRQNSQIGQWEGCRYIQLQSNVGPARIRNILACEARYECLVFMDADTLPAGDDFLISYIAHFTPGGVVCGGFIYPPQTQYPTCPLRYKYGIKVETATAEIRKRNPYTRFIGMNFCADKSVFSKVQFDENMHFGYEDAHFGGMLKDAGIMIIHIDNPVMHLSPDSSEEYLAKTRKSVRNLWIHRDRIHTPIRLLEMWHKLEKIHLTNTTARIFRMTEKLIVRNLTGKNPSIHVFAFYKLGYLCTIIREEQNR